MTRLAEQTAHADRIFKALASSTRREIVTILATASGTREERSGGDEVCACG